MPDLLQVFRDPIWQFLGFVGASILAVVLYLRQRRVRKLAWHTRSEAVLSVEEQLRGRIKIMVDDRPETEVHILVLRLINTGNDPIPAEAYEHPIRFTLGTTAILLTARVNNTSQPSLKPVLKTSPDGLTIEPLLLNDGDWVEIKVIASQFDGPIVVDGRITGVKAIDAFKPPRSARMLRLTYLAIADVLSAMLAIIFLPVGNDNTQLVTLSNMLLISSALLTLLLFSALLGYVDFERIDSSS